MLFSLAPRPLVQGLGMRLSVIMPGKDYEIVIEMLQNKLPGKTPNDTLLLDSKTPHQTMTFTTPCNGTLTFRDIAMAIIKCPQWAKALRNCTEAAWGGTTTPLRKLIRKMPGVLITYMSIVHVLMWLASFSCCRRNTWQLM